MLLGVEKLDDDVPYFRDIPFENLEDAFYFCAYYGLTDNLSGYIGAVILKWLKEGKIDLIKNDNGVAIDFTNFFKVENNWERRLYAKLLASTNSNKILEEYEFMTIFKNEDETNKFFRKMFWSVKNKYMDKGLLWKGNIKKKYVMGLDDSLKEKVLQLKGLKKYLTDFSIIDEREALEVHLWDEYLIYAEMFGIAEKLETEFDNLYPDFKKMAKITTAKMALVACLVALVGGVASTFDNSD